MGAEGDGKGSEQLAAGMETHSLGPVWETWPESSLRAVDCPAPGSWQLSWPSREPLRRAPSPRPPAP